MSRSHRLTRQPLAIGLLGCLLVSGVGRASASGPEAWQRFRSDRGNFSVELPSPPEERQKKRWFPVHSFVSHVYTSSVGEDAFGVNHTDLPRLALFFASQSKIFSSTRDGFLEDSFATETSFAKTERDGQPARFLGIDCNGDHVLQRVDGLPQSSHIMLGS